MKSILQQTQSQYAEEVRQILGIATEVLVEEPDVGAEAELRAYGRANEKAGDGAKAGKATDIDATRQIESRNEKRVEAGHRSLLGQHARPRAARRRIPERVSQRRGGPRIGHGWRRLGEGFRFHAQTRQDCDGV